MDEQIAKSGFRVPNKKNIDLTGLICEAITAAQVSVIHNACVYSTDRPINKHHHGFLGPNGNSEVEAGHSYNVEQVLSVMSSPRERLRMSMNSIRIYGQIPGTGVMHYHGFSKSNLKKIQDSSQVILFVVHSIGEYSDERTITVSDARGTGGNDRAKSVLIYEEGDYLVANPLDVGDMVVLPSGIAHTFAALPGVWASYGVTEIASHSDAMYQTHWLEEEGEGTKLQCMIRNTMLKEGVPEDTPSRLLGLYDIPSMADFIL